ncbi:MAG: hypothetical protein LQ352_003052 [Teloschistes flavicans]|nr:MAG: hypothetical protein LQ352_003052 [Teloschistes flavicans]
MGFKEIDVAFPSASDTEFSFTRSLIDTPNAVPENVWLQVLSPCRHDLIERTVESVIGAKKAIISLYIASSDNFQSTMFGLSQQDVLEIAVDCVKYTKSLTKDIHPETTWNLMFSPEAFSDTDTSYSIALCNAVMEAWEPTTEVPIILNLPATVEMCTPNTFADQVEIFHRAFPSETVVVSLHPHNDRGCAVAAAELGQLAGATRVEGCLFGNGERTGNVDLVTLALNLYTQGVDPHLDFSNLPEIRRIVEALTRIPVHTRAPYAGDSVFLAYSGSHQDAINKGFKKRNSRLMNGEKSIWKVPYLPLDPQDIGASYESVIRVNSQSGKGGVAWTLQRSANLDLPNSLQQEFSKTVKAASDELGRVLSPEDIQELFLKTYRVVGKDDRILTYHISDTGQRGKVAISATILINGLAREIRGKGEDVPAAVSSALAMGTGLQISFEIYERKWTERGETKRIAIARCDTKKGRSMAWGANMNEVFREAELLACLSSTLVYSLGILVEGHRD